MKAIYSVVLLLLLAPRLVLPRQRLGGPRLLQGRLRPRLDEPRLRTAPRVLAQLPVLAQRPQLRHAAHESQDEQQLMLLHHRPGTREK